jgi:hypothetical protein
MNFGPTPGLRPTPLRVDTVLGLLTVAPPAVRQPQDLDTYASAVRVCAKDMTSVVARAPSELRSCVRMLGRAYCGDLLAKDCLRALEMGDLSASAMYQTQIHDMADCDPHRVALAHDFAADGARRGTTLLRRAAALLTQGKSAEASQLVMSAWTSRMSSSATGSAGLASLGAWRAHTGCVCKGILQGGACTCGACAPAGQGA